MAINRLDHAAIFVPDLGKALTWYEDVLGLTVLERTDDHVHLACRGDAADLTVVRGKVGLDHFAFGVDDESDIDRIAGALSQENVGHNIHSGDTRPGQGKTIEFKTPAGHDMRFVVGSNSRRAGISAFESDGTFRPADMDHINLLGDVDPLVMRDFFVRIGLKFSCSLAINGDVGGVWLRGSAFDHDIAYMRATTPGNRLHHVAFSVQDGNHYFRLSDRLLDTGHRWEFGPGRHNGGLGKSTGFATNNYAYAIDPFGNRNEFSSGMEEFPDDAEPLLIQIEPHQLADVMNGWGYEMAESYMTKGT